MASTSAKTSVNVLMKWIIESNREENPGINTLDHKEPELLSEAELKERRDLIEESLKLKENKSRLQKRK